MKKKTIFRCFIALALIFSFSIKIYAVVPNTTSQPKVTIEEALNFGIWQSKGDISVELSDRLGSHSYGLVGKMLYNDFVVLKYDAKTVNPDNYIVEPCDNGVIITLKNEYLNTFTEGQYCFYSEFKEAVIPFDIYIIDNVIAISDLDIPFEKCDETNNYEVIIPAKISNINIYPCLFEKLTFNGNIIDADNYSVSNFCGATMIILNGDYIQTLPEGEKYITAEYSNIRGIKLLLTDTVIPGDIDFDGKVSPADARAIMRLCVNIDSVEALSYSEYKAADIDNDNNITVMDARLILRKSVGLIL